MARKKGFDFGSYIDPDLMNEIISKAPEVAPTEEEVEIVKNAEGDVMNISPMLLSEYHNHTYKVLDNEDMDALVESINDIGIILPLLVRDIGDGHYEVISGHRRLFAAKKIGLETVPCKVITVDDATADIMMVDTNLHREEISPSEKAKSYEVRIKAMKKKGLLKDAEGERQYESQLAEDLNSSRTNIIRYRKLLQLDPILLSLVDSKDIPVGAGAKLAAIPAEQQKYIIDALSQTGKAINADVAEKIVTASKSGLSADKVVSILNGDFKPRKRTSGGSKKNNALKEKNIQSAYPAAIKDLSSEEKAAFIRDCILTYVSSHDTWNDITL